MTSNLVCLHTLQQIHSLLCSVKNATFFVLFHNLQNGDVFLHKGVVNSSKFKKDYIFKVQLLH